MKQLRNWLLFFAAPLLLVFVVSAAATTSTPTRAVKQAGRSVVAVAIDGQRVVYSSDDNAVYVWNIGSGATTQLRRGAGKFTDNPTIREVAIAGKRTAWITLASAGNSQETWARLFTAPVTGPSGRKLASAFRVDGCDEGNIELWNGDWLSGLVGAGDVLAVGRWTTTPNADASGLTISKARLSLIVPGRQPLRAIASGTSSIVPAAVDAGRIAVLRPDDSVGIYSSKGSLLREITPSSAKELAFGGGRVVVLTDTKTLEVYDAGTGALLHTWPVATTTSYAQAGHLSAYGRIGVYLVDARYMSARLHIVDLGTGRETVLSASEHLGSPDAVVGRIGLVYAVNHWYGGAQPRQTGTLVFLSTNRVLAGISAGRLR